MSVFRPPIKHHAELEREMRSLGAMLQAQVATNEVASSQLQSHYSTDPCETVIEEAPPLPSSPSELEPSNTIQLHSNHRAGQRY